MPRLLAVGCDLQAGRYRPRFCINETNQAEGYYPAGVTSTSPLARGVARWYVYDGLGSVIGELDDNNNMTTSGQFDVYGAPRAGTRQGGAATSPQGYVGSLGHVTDASTGGLIYMQARYYDPSLGRFVSEDPKQNGDNWYVYCGNNPTNEVDSDGQSGNWASNLYLMGAFYFGGFFMAYGADMPAQTVVDFILAGVNAAAGTVAAITGAESESQAMPYVAIALVLTAAYSLEVLGAVSSVGAENE